MRLLFRPKEPERPAPPDPGPEAALLEACEACDAAAADLGRALQRRREALRGLKAATPHLGGQSIIARAFSPMAVVRAMWGHRCGDPLGLPQVARPHQSSFVEAATAVIAATATYRSLDQAPAIPGELQETM